MNIKQGATQPHPRAYLEDRTGEPLPLSGGTVRFVMVNNETGVEKVNAVATIVDADTGLVDYEWEASDTDTVGLYRIEWRATLANGDVWKVPSNGVAYLQVIPSP